MPPKKGNNGKNNESKSVNIPVAEAVNNGTGNNNGNGKGNGSNNGNGKGNGSNNGNGNNNGNGVILIPQMSKENLNKSNEGENINSLIAEREGQISPCTIS